MIGVRTYGNGVNGVQIEFNLNELVVLNDLVRDIMKENSDENNDNYSSAAVSLAKIVSNITAKTFNLDDAFDNMMNADKNIFKSQEEHLKKIRGEENEEDEEKFDWRSLDKNSKTGLKILGKIDLP